MSSRRRRDTRRVHAPGVDERRVGTRRRNAGFTLIELLVVVSIVGILAGLAIPNMRTVLMRARATEVAADLEVVRVGVLQFNADSQSWPAETSSGVIPPEIVDFLPGGFTFQGNGYELDYERWDLPGGLPGDPSTRTLIGVSVTTDSDELGNAVAQFLGGSILFSVGNTHTVVIDRM
jgi:prepilin-type N-terminal cleavage/methylation domain-containing protein